MKDSEVHVCEAELSDAAELCRLNMEFNGEGRSVESIQVSIAGGKEWIAIARIGGITIGFACAQTYHSFCYNDLQGEITELYIREAYRRQGAATAILSFLEEKLWNSGVRSVKILTNQKNQAAIHAYTNSGYRVANEAVLHKTMIRGRLD